MFLNRVSPKTFHPLNPNLLYCEIFTDLVEENKIGILDFSFDKDGEDIYIDYIEIIPEYRKKGIGTEVIKQLIEFSRKFGSRRIYLLVDFDNDKAQKFYSKLGFKFTGNMSTGYCYEMELIL